MARGAVPRRIASASTLELELESRPLWGSIPPHRLSGASSTSAGPTASPATRGRPWSSTPGPERVIADDPPLDGRLDAVAQAAKHNPDAEVPGRIPGPL